MTEYNKEFPFPLLYPHVSHKNVLAEWLMSNGLSQYHCAGRFSASLKLITYGLLVQLNQPVGY